MSMDEPGAGPAAGPELKIAEYSMTAAALAILRGKYAGKVFDVAVASEMKVAKAGRDELRGLRIALEAKRKELKAPALEHARLIDAEAAAITDQIKALEVPIADQIKREEERIEADRAAALRKENDRITGIRARIEEIRQAANIPTMNLPGNEGSMRIFERIKALKALDTVEPFAEFSDEASGAKAQSLMALQEAYAQRQQFEDERDAIAAERAKLDAEKAAQAVERARLDDEARQREAAELAAKAAAEEKARAEEAVRAKEKADFEAAQRAKDEKLRQEAEAELAARRKAIEAEEAAQRAERAKLDAERAAKQKAEDDERARLQKIADDAAAAEKAAQEEADRKVRAAMDAKCAAGPALFDLAVRISSNPACPAEINNDIMATFATLGFLGDNKEAP